LWNPAPPSPWFGRLIAFGLAASEEAWDAASFGTSLHTRGRYTVGRCPTC
jgi:hypothetical protein